MARYPGAVWLPIARNHGGTRRRTRAVVLHVDAGGAKSLFGWFNNPAAMASSHFYVTYDGRVEQYLDTDVIAWTQRDGNATCVGIETQGKGDGEWTAAQLDAIDALVRWLCDLYDLPLVDMGTSLPGARGVGLHRYGIDPWRVRDGETWGPRGKVCPGELRVAQFKNVLVPSWTNHPTQDGPTGPSATTQGVDMPMLIQSPEDGIWLLDGGVRHPVSDGSIHGLADKLGAPAAVTGAFLRNVPRAGADQLLLIQAPGRGIGLITGAGYVPVQELDTVAKLQAAGVPLREVADPAFDAISAGTTVTVKGDPR